MTDKLKTYTKEAFVTTSLVSIPRQIVNRIEIFVQLAEYSKFVSSYEPKALVPNFFV